VGLLATVLSRRSFFLVRRDFIPLTTMSSGTIVCRLSESRFDFPAGETVTIIFPSAQTDTFTGLSLKDEDFDRPDSHLAPDPEMVVIQGQNGKTYRIFRQVAESIIGRSEILSHTAVP